MQAKSFLSEKRDAVHHFYATVIRGEISDANVQGYLRAASQIEEIWLQIDEKLAQSISQGMTSWDAYAHLRYPLAFIRAARTYQVFVKELLAADAAFDPRTAGYLPPITYDQANALCSQIQPALQYAIAALNDPAYVPDIPMPLVLGPRIENERHPCPVTHLQGIISATREVREWAAGLLAQYENTIHQITTPVPAEITAHLTALQGLLAQADSQWRFGTDFAGQVTQGQATPEMHMQAEDSLWDALQNYFLLNQAVAMPELLRRGRPSLTVPEAQTGIPSKVYRDLRISQKTSGVIRHPARAANCTAPSSAPRPWGICGEEWAASCPPGRSSTSTKSPLQRPAVMSPWWRRWPVVLTSPSIARAARALS